MRRALALLLWCCLCLTSIGVAAQGLNDIPSPDELRNSNATPLRIDWPADGEVVKVPFTVTGVVTPGARLELWLGGELERKFIADANGRFTTPVSEQTDKIEIRHVGSGPDPIEAVAVTVSFGGAAAPVATGEKNAVPTTTEAEAGATPPPPDMIDPFAEQKVAPTGLPKVSELDGSGTGVAPVPPPPSSTPSAFGQESTTGATAPPVQELDSTYQPPRKRTPSRSVRFFAESGVGVAAGLTVGFAGALVGGALGLAVDPFFGGIYAVLGGLAGYAIGIPIGVTFTGNTMDGNGKWWAAVVGEIAGITVATLISVAWANAFFDATIPVLAYATLPVFGAAAGYEISSDPSAQDAEAAQSVTLLPSVGRTQDGDMTFGLKLRF